MELFFEGMVELLGWMALGFAILFLVVVVAMRNLKVLVSFEETDLENEDGRLQPGVVAKCKRCGHEVESFGTGDPSRRRCLALLNERCPNHEDNYYIDEEE